MRWKKYRQSEAESTQMKWLSEDNVESPILILEKEDGFTPGIVWKQQHVTRFTQRGKQGKGVRCKWLAYGHMASV